MEEVVTAPHEYVVRKWETDKQGNRAFDRFIALIRRFGYADFYYKVRHIYWEDGLPSLSRSDNIGT